MLFIIKLMQGGIATDFTTNMIGGFTVVLIIVLIIAGVTLMITGR